MLITADRDGTNTEDKEGNKKMAKFIKEVGIYRIYELDKKECKEHFREYPTLVVGLARIMKTLEI